MNRIHGVITAMVTPFDGSGAVDVEAARRLARHLVETGSHGLVVAGTTGESPTLSDDEKLTLPGAILEELAAEIPNVAAVKQANNDELGPIEGLDVLAGNDEIFLRCLEGGGVGGILVASHLVGPEMRAVYEAATTGDSGVAREANAGL